MTKTREKMKRKMAKKLRTSSTTNTQTTLPRARDSTMTEGTASWIDAAKWKLAWMPRNKQRYFASDMEIDARPRVSEIPPLYPSASSFPALMILASGPSDVRKARSVKLFCP
jgi:hypothetical protein